MRSLSTQSMFGTFLLQFIKWINISEENVSDKKYRAALLKSRFADTILKAREKALDQVCVGIVYCVAAWPLVDAIPSKIHMILHTR